MRGATYQDFKAYEQPVVDPDGIDSVPQDDKCPVCGDNLVYITEVQSVDPYYTESFIAGCQCGWEI